MRTRLLVLFTGVLLSSANIACAGDGQYPWSGDWYLKIGATGFFAPKFEGASKRVFQAAPLVSLGKAGSTTRFSSRNDNISYAFIDQPNFRAGVAAKLIFGQDADTSRDLKGLAPVKFGGELGGFAEFYPTDWLRIRSEVRQGIRSHHGIVADVAADAFVDVANNVRISGGPRLTAATGRYFDAYYGVNGAESAASGLSAYDPHGGLQSAGVGGAITWKTTERLETGLYAEYRRLLGSAADSSLVRERGNPNQVLIGVSATYRFDFTLQ